mmetsp:Transcript_5648/g.8415  ORF Transcript_5648/g.8415 Transcript_5648/m.8415 type:complete len:223 (-) Transcript_5648:104-772(-)
METFVNHDTLHQRIAVHLGHGIIDNCFQWDLLCSPQANVCSDDKLGLSSADSRRQGIRTKARKYDGMHRANSGTCQHGHGKFRNHGHVDGDLVALLDSLVLQRIGNLGNVLEKFIVGKGLGVSGLISLPNHGNVFTTFTSVGVGMSVNRIVAHVEFTTGEEFDISRCQITMEGWLALGRILEPREALGLFSPEGRGVSDGFGVLGEVRRECSVVRYCVIDIR